MNNIQKPTLYISTTSPFTRMIISIAHLYGVDAKLEFVLPWQTPSELTQANPLSQVPALVLADGTVITETALVLQALVPQAFDAQTLPTLSKALGLLHLGVRSFTIVHFGKSDCGDHPLVMRSNTLLQQALSALPPLEFQHSAGDIALYCALAWLELRLPQIYDSLSDINKQAVAAFGDDELMRKTSADALEKLPKSVMGL